MSNFLFGEIMIHYLYISSTTQILEWTTVMPIVRGHEIRVMCRTLDLEGPLYLRDTAEILGTGQHLCIVVPY